MGLGYMAVVVVNVRERERESMTWSEGWHVVFGESSVQSRGPRTAFAWRLNEERCRSRRV